MFRQQRSSGQGGVCGDLRGGKQLWGGGDRRDTHSEAHASIRSPHFSAYRADGVALCSDHLGLQKVDQGGHDFLPGDRCLVKVGLRDSVGQMIAELASSAVVVGPKLPKVHVQDESVLD